MNYIDRRWAGVVVVLIAVVLVAAALSQAGAQPPGDPVDRIGGRSTPP